MNIQFKLATHRGQEVIFIHFEKNLDLIQRVKKLPQVRWSQSNKSWYVPNSPYYRDKFKLKEIYLNFKIHKLNLIDENKDILIDYIKTLELNGYSPNTVRTYVNEFSQLLVSLGDISVDTLDIKKLNSYLYYCIKNLKLSENTINSRVNAIKFYYEKVLKKERLIFDIPRPKKPSLLPKSIHSNEIKKIFDLTTNLKHNTILKLCYGMGLRVSEIVNIKIEDIDSKSMRVLIQRAKGKKDRYVNLPQSILEQLRTYYKIYKPSQYLFEGQKGEAYSVRSVQMIFKKAMKSANINKKIGVHGLRHSFATHLLENGTDIRFIQELLGHKDIKTTLIYTQVSNKSIQNIKSPLDMINSKI